jgi:hypothetical protein
LQIAESELALEIFLRQLAQRQKGALILDYDGTLTPAGQDHGSAFPYPGVRERLSTIVATGRTRVVIVGAWPAKELIRLLGVYPHPETWGLQELQRLWPNDRSDTYPLVDSDFETLAQAGSWLAVLQIRQLAELTPGGVSLRWEGFAEKEICVLRSEVRKGWIPLAANSRMTLLDYESGMEMRLNGRHKGHPC